MSYAKEIGLTIINWHGCIATDVDGSIVVNSAILPFLSVYITNTFYTSVRLHTERRKMQGQNVCSKYPDTAVCLKHVKL